MLWNTGKAGVDSALKFGGLFGKLDPALYRNRNLLKGMVVSFAGYDALNNQLAGHHMWDNPPGHELDLMIPLKNGDVIYLGFMPSFLAFARNTATGMLALTKGDLKTAGQKFGSLFSMPVKLASEVFSNRDYFGREIYQDYDTLAEKGKKAAKYIGLQINHPFIKETINQLTTDKPLYQSLSEAFELPLKFSSMSKIHKQEFYEAVRKQEAERSRERDKIKVLYERLKQLNSEGKKDELEKLFSDSIKTQEQYDIYKGIMTADKFSKTVDAEIKMYPLIKQIKSLYDQGKGEDGERLFRENITTDEQFKIYQAAKKKLGW